MTIWEDLNKQVDEYILHHKGKVDDKECEKRRFLRCLACPICSYAWSLKFMSNNKDIEEFQETDGLYETDQELEKYFEEHREHIEKHGLINFP